MERYRFKGRSLGPPRVFLSKTRAGVTPLVFSILLCCCLSAWANRDSRPVARDPGPVTRTTSDGSPLLPQGQARPRESGEAMSDERVAERFYQIAYELANSEAITAPQAQQAIVLLTAAKALGSTAQQIHPLLIKLACEHSQRDYSQQVYRWLDEYVSEPTGGGFDPVQGFALVDLEVTKKAIRYLLDRLNSREDRERLLQDLLARLGGKNAALDSQLHTLLGLLMVEKADFKAAQTHFIRAYFNNRCNKLAFAKLAELAPEQVGPTLYLEHLRLVLRENPIDIEVALAFAQYAERLQLYEIAAAAYQYSADLFSYLYPGQALPPNIYLPWLISNYNTTQNQPASRQAGQHKCLQIAQVVRRSGRFDILVEAIAGKAAAKIGNIDEASRIFQAAEARAQQLLIPVTRDPRSVTRTTSDGSRATMEQLAWFYCFALQDEGKALHWANKAFSTDPNSPVAADLLAYALVMNQQLEWAKPLIERDPALGPRSAGTLREPNDEHTQIADLVQAEIALANGQKDSAIETLMNALAYDPGSLAAEQAKEILAKLGQKYRPPVDCDSILKAMRNNFGQAVVAEFISPDKAISVQFNTDGSEFPYGSEFGGTVAIANNSSEPLVISDDGLFKGNIRIDVNISGDINKKISRLISHKIAPANALIEPGKSFRFSLPLVTGELRRILLSYPQASLDIEFTLYLGPPAQDKLPITNGAPLRGVPHQLPSAKVVVKRPGIDLTSAYLRNRFNSISTGQIGPKIKIAELFVGLLKEQRAMAEHGTLYRYKYANWMPSFLKSALLQESGLLLNPADDQWPVKVLTMAEMLWDPALGPRGAVPLREPSLPLDFELINAVAKNLNDPYWPVRMMAVYLLAKGSAPDQVGSGLAAMSRSGFDKVLDWSAKNDSNSLVRDMAVAFLH